MSFSWSLFFFSLLAPPAVCIWLALLGSLLLLTQRKRLAGLLLGLGLGSLYLLSTGLVAGWLAAGLEREPALNPAAAQGYQAIVILGGGRDLAAPEYGGADVPNYWATARLRYGAHLYRQTGLPLLVSGGTVYGERNAEASLMAEALIRDFVVNVRWQEAGSRTTWENAGNSRALLKPEGVDRILLVTTASHMRRARMAFEHAGFTVRSAPTDFADFSRLPLALQLVPSAQALLYSRQALHEYIGLVWYGLKALVD